MPVWKTPFEEIKVGTGRKIRDGEDIALLTLGHVGNYAVEVCERLSAKHIEVAHFDMRFVKPLDEELLHEACSSYKKIITIEDGTVIGGFGTAVLEFMSKNNYYNEVKILGIPDRIVEHGSLKELHAECGYDSNSIVNTALSMMNVKVKSGELMG